MVKVLFLRLEIQIILTKSMSMFSLAIDKSGVYIGIGNRQIPFEKNGIVLWVEYS